MQRSRRLILHLALCLCVVKVVCYDIRSKTGRQIVDEGNTAAEDERWMLSANPIDYHSLPPDVRRVF